ncbi:hypothetical protein [Weissella minor]|uniref:hypothetical protein n=1 Tax=Weissella minor TaxID=1620 RepID=UPI003AF3109D
MTNEITTQEVEYYQTELAQYPEVVDELRIHSQNINNIREKSALDLGKELFTAKKLLQENGIGNSFNSWSETIDFSTSTAYNLANYYEATLSLSEAEQEIYSQLPKGLAYTLSSDLRKSEEERDDSTQQVLDTVFKGDIKTLPEYKAAIEEIETANAAVLEQKELELSEERKLRESVEQDREDVEQELISVKDDYAEIRQALDEQREKVDEQVPEVKIVEKIPEDYLQLKEAHDRTMGELNNLKELTKQQASELSGRQTDIKELQIRLQEVQEDDENHKALQLELDRKEAEVTELRQKNEELQNLGDTLISTNEFVDVKLANLLGHLQTASAESRQNMRPALLDLVDKLEKMTSGIGEQLREDK